jgi:hypothetical protein
MMTMAEADATRLEINPALQRAPGLWRARQTPATLQLARGAIEEMGDAAAERKGGDHDDHGNHGNQDPVFGHRLPSLAGDPGQSREECFHVAVLGLPQTSLSLEPELVIILTRCGQVSVKTF